MDIAAELLDILRCSQCKGSLTLTEPGYQRVSAVASVSATRAGSEAGPVSASRSDQFADQPVGAPDPVPGAQAWLDCPVCRLRFSIRDGIPIMLIDAATSW